MTSISFVRRLSVIFLLLSCLGISQPVIPPEISVKRNIPETVVDITIGPIVLLFADLYIGGLNTEDYQKLIEGEFYKVLLPKQKKPKREDALALLVQQGLPRSFADQALDAMVTDTVQFFRKVRDEKKWWQGELSKKVHLLAIEELTPRLFEHALDASMRSRLQNESPTAFKELVDDITKRLGPQGADLKKTLAFRTIVEDYVEHEFKGQRIESEIGPVGEVIRSLYLNPANRDLKDRLSTLTANARAREAAKMDLNDHVSALIKTAKEKATRERKNELKALKSELPKIIEASSTEAIVAAVSNHAFHQIQAMLGTRIGQHFEAQRSAKGLPHLKTTLVRSIREATSPARGFTESEKAISQKLGALILSELETLVPVLLNEQHVSLNEKQIKELIGASIALHQRSNGLVLKDGTYISTGDQLQKFFGELAREITLGTIRTTLTQDPEFIALNIPPHEFEQAFEDTFARCNSFAIAESIESPQSSCIHRASIGFLKKLSLPVFESKLKKAGEDPGKYPGLSHDFIQTAHKLWDACANRNEKEVLDIAKKFNQVSLLYGGPAALWPLEDLIKSEWSNKSTSQPLTATLRSCSQIIGKAVEAEAALRIFKVKLEEMIPGDVHEEKRSAILRSGSRNYLTCLRDSVSDKLKNTTQSARCEQELERETYRHLAHNEMIQIARKSLPPEQSEQFLYGSPGLIHQSTKCISEVPRQQQFTLALQHCIFKSAVQMIKELTPRKFAHLQRGILSTLTPSAVSSAEKQFSVCVDTELNGLLSDSEVTTEDFQRFLTTHEADAKGTPHERFVKSMKRFAFATKKCEVQIVKALANEIKKQAKDSIGFLPKPVKELFENDRIAKLLASKEASVCHVPPTIDLKWQEDWKNILSILKRSVIHYDPLSESVKELNALLDRSDNPPDFKDVLAVLEKEDSALDQVLYAAIQETFLNKIKKARSPYRDPDFQKHLSEGLFLETLHDIPQAMKTHTPEIDRKSPLDVALVETTDYKKSLIYAMKKDLLKEFLSGKKLELSTFTDKYTPAIIRAIAHGEHTVDTLMERNLAQGIKENVADKSALTRAGLFVSSVSDFYTGYGHDFDVFYNSKYPGIGRYLRNHPTAAATLRKHFRALLVLNADLEFQTGQEKEKTRKTIENLEGLIKSIVTNELE